MASHLRNLAVAALALAAIIGEGGWRASRAASVSFADFSDVSAWQLNGSAAQATNAGLAPVLRLTPAVSYQAGSAFLSSPFAFNTNTSFQSSFQFQFSQFGGLGPADGLVFTLQSIGSGALGSAGSGIGYEGLVPSVGVELDSWDNGAIDSDSSNHVGVDLNGNIASAALSTNLPFNYADGSVNTAWIDYDGLVDLLEIRLSPSAIRPALPTLSASVDLTAILGGSDAFVGFTAATGGGYEHHDVLNFSLTTFTSLGAPASTNVPGPLPGMGVAVGLRFSRSLRRRIGAHGSSPIWGLTRPITPPCG